MKKIHLVITVFLMILAFGCKKENLEKTSSHEDNYNAQFYIDKAEAALALDAEQQSTLDFRGTTVTLAAGSENALQEAIAEAGVGGTVVLEAGLHTESTSVLISHRVNIKGEEGAILQFDTDPSTSGFPATSRPGLHVLEAAQVRIQNLIFQDTDGSGNTAILIESSDRARVSHNRFEGFQYGVLLHEGNRARIHHNEMIEQQDLAGYGILNINGKDLLIYNNTIRDNDVAVFLGDDGGKFIGNNLLASGGDIGLLLCTPSVGGIFVELPSGELVGAESSANEWIVWNNYAEGNLWNYLVIDNAHRNTLINNRSENAVLADIEMAGDTERFGFPSPTSYDNLVISYDEPDIRIKVCGEGNFAVGGTLIDTNESPCN